MIEIEELKNQIKLLEEENKKLKEENKYLLCRQNELYSQIISERAMHIYQN